MQKLTRSDLWSLEEYAKQREAFRNQVIEHKINRKVFLNEHTTLYFEDRITMQYQVQEMLRVERIFEADAIQEELDAYNPLIPDTSNLKATFMIEFTDAAVRQQELSRLMGIEDKVWIQVAAHDRVFAIADEDMQRDTETRTSAVHFMRFEFNADMVGDFKSGASVSMGIDHENMTCRCDIDGPVQKSLAADFS